MEVNKPKEGVSVKEIEIFAKKHRIELVFCLAFVLACFFSFVFWGSGWGVVLASAGGIIGSLLPAKIERLAKSIFHFIFKQEAVVQIVLGGVFLILSIFIPPLIYLILGLHGGKHLYHQAMEMFSSIKKG